MFTLTIDGLVLEVIGGPSWSSGGIQSGVPSAGFIAAQVRLPAPMSIEELDKTNAHVMLDLGGGRTVEGRGMRRVGDLRTNGDVMLLRFEGPSVMGRM